MTYIYNRTLEYVKSDELIVENGLQTAIRFLLHFIADIHQPLHATSRVNSNYPDGDKGGNEFDLPSHYGADSLHAVWDKVVYEFKYYPTLPFTDETWAEIGDYANEFTTKFPMDESLIVDEMDPLVWAQESWQITKDFVYVGITENEELP